MKQLSQSERNEIDVILSHRRAARLKELDAKDPGWKQRVEDRKNKVALGRLRVEKDVVELKAIESQIRDLENKKQLIDLRISTKMPRNKREVRRGCPTPKDLCEAVAEICEEIHEAEMAKDPTGKKALAIAAEHVATRAQFAMCSTREDVAARKIL